MRATASLLSAATLVTLAGAVTWGADATSAGRREAQAALKEFGGLVGDWRGSAQVERGKTKGAWQEDASWAWKLTADSAALEGKITRGKYLKSLLVKPGDKAHTYTAEAVLPDGTTRSFSGKAAAKKALLLTADQAGGDGVKRITLTPLHDTRLLLLLEGQDLDKDFTRLGEVGYTRKGVAFAAGESGPVCIVTEGRGTMPVSYKGKTYYVCCSGCKDLFNENPEAILAEAAEREKAKKK
ncbi:MAG: YHS domain-containing protein [Isosphaeraceae bacterium]|nr:YHS domain-containing protein [Isosphaeraceae bacterium]